MPELPEVETVRRGLEPTMLGATFEHVELRREGLRIPFPHQFARRLEGARVDTLSRRGKYLLAGLSTGETLVMHLGMSGRFSVAKPASLSGPDFSTHDGDPKHDHVIFVMSNEQAHIVYNDPRRFGFMDLVETEALESSRHFSGMGPEPLGNAFTVDAFKESISKRAAPIKSVLLDQSVVAGLGNIYVCEALFRAGISPRRKAKTVAGARSARLYAAIRSVLEEAIHAGGSSLRDFSATDGALGYFQHSFAVYGREGARCQVCHAFVSRIVQAGRSTFFCGRCQR